MNKFLALCCAFLFCFLASAQLDTAFLMHLEKLRLKDDHFHYLKQLPQADLSVQKLYFTYHILYEQDTALIRLSKAYPEALDDPKLLYRLSLYFLPQTDGDREKWFACVDSLKWSGKAALLNHYYQSANIKGLPFPEHMPDELLARGEQMKKVFKKKAWLAAMFSAIVPGSGRWYAGRRRLALGSFFINGLNVWRSVESADHLGVRNPLSLVNFSMLAVFYVSNITGSARELKLVQSEHRNQFLYEVATFYRLYYPMEQ